MDRRTVLKAGTTAAAGMLLGCRPQDVNPKEELAMLNLRKAENRFHTNWGWLDSHHTFSFGDHYDPRHMGFRALRVINDDRITGGAGFPMHPHKDMEILSYVLDGALEHKDSMGNGSIIKPGDVQRMSAGTGVRHSEFNPQKNDGTHFLQIWLMPDRNGDKPGYEQKQFSAGDRAGTLRLVASKDGRDGSVTIHSSVDLYASVLGKGDEVKHQLAKGRQAWVQVAKGSVVLNGQRLEAGDGASTDDQALILNGAQDAEVLVFDLA